MNLFKRSFSKDIVKSTLIYTVTDAIGKAISFILLPFLSYYMAPEGLGLATNFAVLTQVITLLAGSAIINSLTYFFYERTKEENCALVSNLIIISFIACVLLLLVVLLTHSIITQYFKLSYNFQILSILCVFVNVVNNLDMQLFRLEDKPKSFAFYQIIQISFNCLMVILFVIILKLGGEGKIIAEIIVILMMGLIHFIVICHRGYFTLRVDKACINLLLKFGLPLMPHSISFWFKSGADKVFITTFCGLAINGIYSMAISISSLYSVVTQSFFRAYVPMLQKKLALITPENEMHEKNNLVKTIYLMIGIFFIVSILSIFGGWVVFEYIVDEKYKAGFQFLPGFILSLYIYVIYSFSIEFIYKRKKTLMLGLITFTGSLIQMGLSYLFVKNFGAIGAVYSSIIGSILISFGIFTYSYIVYPMPWFFFLKRKNE